MQNTVIMEESLCPRYEIEYKYQMSLMLASEHFHFPREKIGFSFPVKLTETFIGYARKLATQ
jgi:hypothetical protein